MTTSHERAGVLVLYNHSQRLIKGDARDLTADQGVIACAYAVAEALSGAGWRVVRLPFDADVELALAPYPPTDWVIFNLGEGLEGRLFEEARIAWALDAMGYRFTGNRGDALALSAHKGRTRERLAAAGAPTPPGALFRHPAEVTAPALAGLSFPCIVKPVAEDASQGIGPEAVAHDMAQLRARVAYVTEHYRQMALAEAFIVGREFNISLWGEPAETLPLAEIDFSAFANPHERIVSFAAKWDADSFEFHHTPVVCPAQVEPGVGRRIADAARRAWQAVGCRGYARVDMRLAADNTPYIVEVNCNPDISPDAGFFRAAQTAGYDYTGMVERILRLATEQREQVYG